MKLSSSILHDRFTFSAMFSWCCFKGAWSEQLPYRNMKWDKYAPYMFPKFSF